MKKYTALFACCLILSAATTVFAQQGGFTGPSSQGFAGGQSQFQNVTVSQLQTVNNKSYVVLTGSITQSLGRNRYTFQDATGQITVEIEQQYWWNLTLSPSDSVEMLVKVENKRNRTEVEAKGMRKI